MVRTLDELKDRLVMVREGAGYKSRKQFCEEIGISYRTVSNYETGEREPGNSYIARLADFCGVTTDYILGLSDDPHGVFQVNITDDDHQIMQITDICRGVTAQGLEHIRLFAEITAGNPEYQKKK